MALTQHCLQAAQTQAPQTQAMASNNAAQPQVSQQGAAPYANLQVGICHRF